MHAADFSLGILGANGIVGAGAPIATGAAWALRRAGHGRAVAVTLLRRRRGEPGRAAGGVQPGRALAGAGAVRLREQRLRHHDAGRSRRSPARSPAARPRRSASRPCTVDGMDPEAVLAAAARRSARARPAAGRRSWSAVTYRFDAHHTWEHGRGSRYRTDEEVERWRGPRPGGDPGRDARPPPTGTRSTREVEALLDEAVEFALGSPHPDPADALDHLYADGRRARDGRSPMPRLSYLRRSAGRSRDEMARDPTRRSCSARTSRVAASNVTAGPARPVRPGAGAGHAAVGAGVHQLRHRRGAGRAAAGDRVPDPVAAVPGLRADRQPGAQVLADDRRAGARCR